MSKYILKNQVVYVSFSKRKMQDSDSVNQYGIAGNSVDYPFVCFTTFPIDNLPLLLPLLVFCALCFVKVHDLKMRTGIC